MKRATICAAAFAALCMTSCGTGKKAVSITDFSGVWNIVSVKGETVDAEETPYLNFDQKTNRVYGHAGCNRLMGSYHVDSLNAGKVKFGQMMTTKMMCPEMNLERNVLDALNKTEGFVQTGDTIELKDAGNNRVMTLQKRVKPELALEDLAGRWIVTNIGSVAVGEVERTPELNFDMAEKRVHGNASCNTINGSFSQEEGKPASLRFSQMISTMMACPNMETEGNILKALNQVRSFDCGEEDNTVVLLDENGYPVLTLSRAESQTAE